MNRYVSLTASVLAAALVMPTAGAAVLSTEAEYLIGGVSTLLDANSAPGGTVTSTVTAPPGDFTSTLDFSGDAYGRALNINGITAVDVNGVFAAGGSGPPGARYGLQAEAILAETVTNNSGAAQEYSYDFTVFGPVLEIADFAGASAGASGINVGYDIQIRVNGSAVWTSSALLNGGSVSHTLTENGTDLGGTFFGTSSVFGYLFDDLTTSVALGTLADGASLDFEAIVSVSVDADPFELGGRARIGDPGDINAGTPGLRGMIVSSGTSSMPLPEPAPLAVVAIGALVIGAVRRRRNMT